ncbi:MAG TPA: sigma-54 dependent transcriptional regulator [Dongiaceae bacterium]|nr:sigma-54 dependent transcriptional regulator [Dongiaceae bacterium]
MNNVRILIVEDDPLFGVSLKRSIESVGYDASLAKNGLDALQIASEQRFDLLLQDLQLPDAKGLDVMQDILAHQPACRALVMTGYASIDVAVEAMKRGATDFVTKPIPMELLIYKLRRLVEFRSMEIEIEFCQGKKGNIVSKCPLIRDLLATATLVAETDSTVMLMGESGTGKELMAEFIHNASKQRTRPLIKVNCAAIPENLVESELFGVARGAFTDAQRDKPGLLEEANRGTLFLDEVAELPLQTQAKLLRVLDDRKITRLGDVRVRQVDFRLVTATNRNLRKMVEEKTFREDLWYRLNVIPLVIPPLRERKVDIPLLIAYFQMHQQKRQEKFSLNISPEALDLLCCYSYPGNVRELKHIVEQLCILYPNELITPRQLPLSLRDSIWIGHIFESFPVGRPLKEAVSEFEMKYIEKVLASVSGKKTIAAEILGLSRKVLWEKLTKFHYYS